MYVNFTLFLMLLALAITLGIFEPNDVFMLVALGLTPGVLDDDEDPARRVI